MTKRYLSLVLLLVCLMASAQAVFACTQDQLMLDGRPLLVKICDLGHVVGNNHTQTLQLSERFIYGGRTLDHDTTVMIPASAISPRAIDQLDLAPLGIDDRLHLTIRLTRNGPLLERAFVSSGPTILR